MTEQLNKNKYLLNSSTGPGTLMAAESTKILPSRIITRKYNPKIHIKPQKKWIVKTILRKKKDGGTLPDFKPYYKIVGYWPKNRHTHQWKRIKNLEINYAYAAN